ncbi:predicted protein [Plenodomus lingam JN3]|uniref:Predicted protein n=1 Tax=Leptosphaeria maculans (strain JN3 / isolate v23.1.3 / race Av1-4-5-6-7-8) TaxID=985895 RepID=E4ZJB8_LEPMJ|nr:predicted protein [Plenodomus lingam JN3]CBX91549.1 predicted protein [Plenodomus lingam JN3]
MTHPMCGPRFAVLRYITTYALATWTTEYRPEETLVHTRHLFPACLAAQSHRSRYSKCTSKVQAIATYEWKHRRYKKARVSNAYKHPEDRQERLHKDVVPCCNADAPRTSL